MVVIKSEWEIEKMRAAGQIVGQTLRLLRRMVVPGTVTKDLDTEADRFIRGKGAIPTFKGYSGFPASICISVNEQIVHGFPSSRKLKEGDIVSIDCGATLDGYIGDSATTICVGKCSPEVLDLVATTEKSLHAAIALCLPGVHLGTVSHAVETVAGQKNYGVVREYCGHGVGRQLHEPPQVPNYGFSGQGPILSKGWTIAIEPMLNMGTHEVRLLHDGWTVVTKDSKPSAHFEHSIAVTDEKPIILTLP
jgi:methionyl aminopeptidase